MAIDFTTTTAVDEATVKTIVDLLQGYRSDLEIDVRAGDRFGRPEAALVGRAEIARIDGVIDKLSR